MRAYNDYIADDCRAWRGRLFPVGLHLAGRRRRGGARGAPLRRGARHDRRPRAAEPAGAASGGAGRVPGGAAAEARLSSGLPSRSSRRRSSSTSRVGVHGSPGVYLPSGIAEQVDTFILSHIFGHRNQMQMALAAMRVRGPVRPLPDAAHGLPRGRLRLGARIWCTPSTSTGRSASATSTPGSACRADGSRASCCASGSAPTADAIRCARSARRCDLYRRTEHETRSGDTDAFLIEHRGLDHDPVDFFRRGQIFVSFESDDPAPAYLREALGEMGEDLACFSARLRTLGRRADGLREERRARATLRARAPRQAAGRQLPAFLRPPPRGGRRATGGLKLRSTHPDRKIVSSAGTSVWYPSRSRLHHACGGRAGRGEGSAR